MHLKILIGVLILGIASASPKAAPKPKPKPKPKPIVKATPQFYQGYPGAQPNYFPGAPSYFGQGINPQPILGHDASGRYDPRFPPSGYQSTFGTAFGAQETYPQASIGNYYQPPQAPPGNYNQPPQVPSANYYQSPQAPAGGYYQPPQAPAANYYQSPQAQAANYYQSPQVPAANYYQTPQPPAANYNQSPQAPAANYYQTPQPPAANYNQSPQAPAANYYQTSQPPAANYNQPPQAPAGNNYQSPQLIPIPVGYPSGSSAQSGQSVEYPGGSLAQGAQPVVYPGGSPQSVQPPNYSESARLWPKALISPAGSPSPVPDSLARAYYAVSTPSPLDFSSPYNQSPLSTHSSVPFSQQNLIPVPVKVGSRNSFQPEITNYSSISQNIPNPGSTSANYQQQSTPTPYDQRYLQPPGSSFSTSAPQSPTATRYPVNYKSSPAPFQANYQQSNQAPPAQGNYQSTPAPPVQASFEQQSTPSPYPLNYQQTTPAPYQGNYQLSGVSSRSPFADYQQQPSSPPNAAQYQQQSVSPFGPRYQPTDSPYQQPIPVPVAYPQSQFEIQPPPSTPVTLTQPTPATPTPSYPSVPVTSKPINILPTSPTPVNDVSITENTFVPIPTPSGSNDKIKATIIKSEYSGTVSPQYNHIPLASTSYKYSTLRPFLDESAGKSSHGLSYSPAKALVPYSSSTDVSQVSFQSLGNSYSY